MRENLNAASNSVAPIGHPNYLAGGCSWSPLTYTGDYFAPGTTFIDYATGIRIERMLAYLVRAQREASKTADACPCCQGLGMIGQCAVCDASPVSKTRMKGNLGGGKKV